MKKITLQDIATELNISRVTVWKALNDRKGVSSTLRDEIIEKAVRMGYPLAFPEEEPAPSTVPKKDTTNINVSVVVSRPETSVFWMNIIHNAARTLSEHGVNLIYTYLPNILKEDYNLPPILTNGSIQGMIVLNIYDYKLFSILNNLPVMKIFMDCIPGIPFHTLHGDLFLLEGKLSTEIMTQHVIKKGCNIIGFIGDIQYSQTNHERYMGYLSALSQNHLSVISRYNMIGPIGPDTHQEEINHFLEQLSDLPDAFICASDYIAQLTVQCLKKNGYEIPKDILITGFDDNPESMSDVALTTVHVQNEHIGIRLANQLLYHLNYPEADNEITYIRSKIIYRESTDDEEIKNEVSSTQ